MSVDPTTCEPDLIEADLAGLRSRLASAEVSARELADGYLRRIEAIDRAGPSLRAVIELSERAAETADARDQERRADADRGLLHGVPLLIKDNIGTTDGMETTAGSLALVGARPHAAATVAERLDAAGAVILGKTNLSEWANIRSTHSSSGWSGRGGQTLNPYALDVTPSGSSSGSGAAVAASLAVAALGTETNGSILCPAAVNGLVGIKPTVGLVSRFGVIPISATQDTVGPMARTVRDAALLLAVIAGSDPRDPATAEADARRQPYHERLDPSVIRGARIGVPRRRYWGYSPSADRVAERALDTLRRLGAEIIDPADIEPEDADPTGGKDMLDVLMYEFHDGINNWLAALGDRAPVRDLAGLIAFNRDHAGQEMPFFGQELFEQAVGKGPLTETAYRDARQRSRDRFGRDGIDRVMDDHRLDALVMPTMNPAAKIDLVNGEAHHGSASTPAAVAGYPSLTVPAGDASGLPVGITFMGRRWSEQTLIDLAFAFEQETRARFPPTYAAAGVLPPGAGRVERA